MEKSVEIGVKVVSIILFLMFLFPITVGGWLVYDAVDVLSQSEVEEAMIVECSRKRSATGRGARKRYLMGHFAYNYVAESDDGVKVKSTFGFNKRSQCREYIGQTVSLYLYQPDLENSRIKTFVQFWVLPIVGGLLSLLFLYVTYRGFRWFFKI